MSSIHHATTVKKIETIKRNTAIALKNLETYKRKKGVFVNGPEHRDKCLNILSNLLSKEIPEKYNINFENVEKLATIIEKGINNAMFKELCVGVPVRQVSWKQVDVSQTYHKYFFKVYSNLYLNKNSLFLIQCIKDKTIRPVDIVTVEHKYLISPEQVEGSRLKMIELCKKYNMLPTSPKKTTPGLFKCGRCKSQMTSFTTAQTRSADESETVYILCQDCGNRWKR
jgi:DNA-directed RNA polymerase subunit M/transcription elongation factor TFIIS